MTRDDIKKQFPDATEEQVTALLNIYGTDITEAKKNNVEPKELKRLQDIEKEYKKLEDADLTDAEKISIALKEAEDAKVEFNKKSNRLEVEKILVGAGLTEEDYKDLIEGIVSDNLETSKTLATSLTAMLGKQKESAIQKTKEELMDGTTTPGADGAGSGEGTKKSEAETTAEAIGKSVSGLNTASKSIVDSYL